MRSIVFIGYKETDTGIVGNPALYSVRSDGSGLRRLTTPSGRGYTSPAVSRDGSLIAFGADDSLWVMRFDGSQQHVIPNAILRCDYERIAWGPTNDQVVASCNGTSWLIDLRTGDATNLKPLIGEDVVRPDWSPDGTLLAYNTGGTSDVHAAPITGGPHTTLVAAGYTPSWSPDGTQLLFANDSGVGPHLERENSDGTGRTDLVTPTDTRHDEWPTWSPTGDMIAFDRQVESCTPYFCAVYWRVVVALPDGTGARFVTPDTISGTRPAW